MATSWPRAAGYFGQASWQVSSAIPQSVVQNTQAAQDADEQLPSQEARVLAQAFWQAVGPAVEGAAAQAGVAERQVALLSA